MNEKIQDYQEKFNFLIKKIKSQIDSKEKLNLEELQMLADELNVAERKLGVNDFDVINSLPDPKDELGWNEMCIFLNLTIGP